MTSKTVQDSLTFKSVQEEVIPWKECGRLVRECNPNNRHMAKSTVWVYRCDIAAGRWIVTHEAVAFGPGETQPVVIIDGQHRLEAHYLEQRDYRGLVARYATRDAAKNALIAVNTGRSRATNDVLVVAGKMAADRSKRKVATATLLHALFFGNQEKTSKYEIGAFYVDHRAAIDWAVGLQFKGAMLPASLAVAWLDAPDDVEKFVALISEGAGAPGSAAAYWNKMLPTALTTSGSGGMHARIEVCFRALRILKAELNHEPPPSRLYTTPEALGWFLRRLRVKGVGVKLFEERSGPDMA